ncbi:MAG: dTDP-4-amino-4,6-dideoxygalactose transaminase [Oligoflexia bacterium]|nr:dTDP-4-amino-4,6-dideoxygalactose transaminase [Oligoflexia bacterium]
MIPFNQPSFVGNEEKYFKEAMGSAKWCGRGPKTLALEKLAKEKCQVKHAFFVTSCSSALEIGCILANLKPQDEVILPSFGFVSAANAIVMAGAKPVFADINPQTWNLDLENIKKVFTAKTKAIITVHYAGSSAHVEEIRDFCKQKGLFLIEDAAQSLGATRDNKPIGSSPWVTCFSLHDTKNIACGEGGFIMTDSDQLASRIEIIIEKGTNRQKFLRGQVDKYTWVDRGGSYVASDFLAAIALAQLEKMEAITKRRVEIYNKYVDGLKELVAANKITWQKTPVEIKTNGHIAAFLVDSKKRDEILKAFKVNGVSAMFHYVPLHDSPYAKELSLAPASDLANTQIVWESLIRLPIYYSLTDAQVSEVIRVAKQVI